MDQQVEFAASQPTLGRNAAFFQGQAGTPGNTASSLAADSARFNDQVGQGFTPDSVLSQFTPSQNGQSKTDYDQRMLAGGLELPSANGSSSDTYNAEKIQRLMGQLV